MEKLNFVVENISSQNTNNGEKKLGTKRKENKKLLKVALFMSIV